MDWAFYTDDMVLDGPGDVLGAGSLSPLVTNLSIEPVMTRNPSYKQIIKFCFGLNGKLHNEINVNTSLTKIKMQLMQIRLQLIIIFIIIWFEDISIFQYFYMLILKFCT